MQILGNQSPGIELHLDQLQRSRCKKKFIEIGLKSLVWIWATFPLAAIIIYSNNTIRLMDNAVKTLEKCKAWKEPASELRSPVIGIKVHISSGCPICKFSHDRVREVTVHMDREHDLTDEAITVPCSI